MDDAGTIEVGHDAVNRLLGYLLPDRWYEAYPRGVSDAGDVGGDVQAGDAHSRRFIRHVSADDGWLVLDVSYYVCECDHGDDAREADSDGEQWCKHCGALVWVEEQSDLTECTDPADPGSTELRSDVRYRNCCDDEHSEPTDAYARQCAEQLCAEQLDDPWL